MDALSMSESPSNNCIHNPTYADYAQAGHTVGCGNRLSAIIYFTAYSIIVPTVFLSLFVAIVLNGYFTTNEKHRKEKVKEQTERFQRCW
jgi:hypothetical protein